MRIRGIKEIKKAMQEHREQTAESIRRGLMKVGLFVQRESQLRTPVDTSNLRNGADTRFKKTTKGASVRVVYVAAYAVFVHENMHARHPIGRAKFLATAVTDNLPRIQTIFRNEFK